MLRAISNLITKQTCPYCFEQFMFRDAPFRCSNLSCKGQVVDNLFLEKWPALASGGRHGRVLSPSAAKRGKATCDDCQRATEDRICPGCHAQLPPTYGKCENAIIAVIGGINAGKSHYIATLVEELRNNVGPTMNFTLSPENDFTINRFNEDFKQPLYHHKRAIRKTGSAKSEDKLRIPMLFNLQFMGKDVFGRKAIKKTVTLVFFDAAGEDLEDEGTMSTVNRYVYRSAGIILLFDPRQIPYVRSKLAIDATEPIVDTRAILKRTANIIRKGLDLNANAIIKTPIAVAFSKFDEVERFVDRGACVLNSRSVTQEYDAEEAAAISDEIEALLESWQQKGLCHELRSWFYKISFFGVSSLGCQAKEMPGSADKQLPHVPRPKRVEDPFLWLLSELKFFKPGTKKGD